MASVPHRHRQYALWRRRKDVDREGREEWCAEALGDLGGLVSWCSKKTSFGKDVVHAGSEG